MTIKVVTNIKFIYCCPTLPVQIVADAWDGKAGPETHCLCNIKKKSIHSFWVSGSDLHKHITYKKVNKSIVMCYSTPTGASFILTLVWPVLIYAQLPARYWSTATELLHMLQWQKVSLLCIYDEKYVYVAV